MKSVRGRSVLVTGAAMGMGRLFAERAIAEEARSVCLWDVDEMALNKTLAELEEGSTEVSGYVVDVGNQDEVVASAEMMLDDLGPIEVLVNNAGIVRGNQFFWETDLDQEVKSTIDVNTLGAMYVAHRILPAMIGSPGECRILNIASAAGLAPNPRMAAYAASKWAVIGWSDSLRLELAQAGHTHVKVTTACPYYVATGMFDGVPSTALLPVLDPADVVDETWSAAMAGRPFVIMPKTVQLSEMLKGFAPTGARDFIADRVFGVYHTMSDFTGDASDP